MTGGASPRSRRRKPLRFLLVVLLIAAGGVGTALAPVAWWVHGLVSDSHRYVNTVAPLAANTDLQMLVSTEVTARVSSALNLGSVTALQLPPAPRHQHSPTTEKPCLIQVDGFRLLGPR